MSYLAKLKEQYRTIPNEVKKLDKESFKMWAKKTGYKKGNAIKSLNKTLCRITQTQS